MTRDRSDYQDFYVVSKEEAKQQIENAKKYLSLRMSGEGKARHRLHEMPLIVVSYPCFMPFDFLEEIEVLCSISISNKRLLSCSKHIKIKMFNCSP